MPTFTPNFNFAKPTVSGDVDTWGGFLNANFDTIDTQLKTALDLTGANVGAGATLFESKTSNQLRFKTLQPAATTNVAITSDADEVFFGRTDEQTDVRGNLRDVPVNVQNATYTFALADRGRQVQKNNSTAYTWTIPPQVDVAWTDAAITVANDGSAGAVTIAPGAGVTLLEGAVSGSFTLQPAQVRTLLRMATNRWRVV
ncbi:MAG: hypothetical protein ACK5NX_01325 [Armatimonadota bacterium]